MRRVLAALSLLLYVAARVMWVRSEWVEATVYRNTPTSMTSALGSGGSVASGRRARR
jgi:hypothetical protein